jgi:hypothetical protein
MKNEVKKEEANTGNTGGNEIRNTRRTGTKEMHTDRKNTSEKKVSAPYLSSPKGLNRLCGSPSVYRGEFPGSKAAEA